VSLSANALKKGGHTTLKLLTSHAGSSVDDRSLTLAI
jgi:hypothetical protein